MLKNIISFLSISKKVSAVEFLVRQQTVHCSLVILVKREPKFTRFSGLFPKFLVQLFQKTLMKRFVRSLLESLVVDYRPVFWLEVSPPKKKSWNLWRRVYPHKKVCDSPFIVVTCNISINRLVLDIILQIVVKRFKFESRSSGIPF